MHVLATAGHVDHGKSTLVRLLTGMEPDRWAEEHRRGLTIDLGFAWTYLDDGEPLAFVDVPGHEKFVTNMLAGAGPAPATMFVVAADEGWMPQSEEHLGALHALGVAHGLLVITRCDLADAEPARQHALEQIMRTSLGSVPSVVVSGRTGAGLDTLRTTLADVAACLPSADTDADVRLWVDRSFTITGAGTVVTGTLTGGTVRVGQRLSVASSGRSVVVRGVQTLGEQRDEVAATARVALNLRGLDHDAIGRGEALTTPGAWRLTDTVDVALHTADAVDGSGHGNGSHRFDGVGGPDTAAGGGDDDSARTPGSAPARLPRELVLHLGSAAIATRVRVLNAGIARLRLRRPLPLRVGDRGLLRDPGQHRVAAGIVCLDVAVPSLDRRGAARERAHELADASASPAERVARLQLRRRGFLTEAELTATGLRPAGRAMGQGWYVDESVWSALIGRARSEHRDWCANHPTAAGMPREALRQRLELPTALLPQLVDEAGLSLADGMVQTPNATTTLPPAVEEAVRALEADFAAAPFVAPEAARLAELGLGRRELAAAERAGRLWVLAAGIVVAPDGYERARSVLAELHQPFTLSQARQALGSTRRVVVPLLELLDRDRVTERLDDGTHRLR